MSRRNFPSNVTEISPVSSDTITVNASDTSEIPTAALCLVPKLLDILGLSEYGDNLLLLQSSCLE